MPLFRYRCTKKKCGLEFEEFFHNRNDGATAPCPKCQTPGKRILSAGKFAFASGHFFEPGWNYDLAKEPVWINSLDHFKRECRERGFEPKQMRPKLK